MNITVKELLDVVGDMVDAKTIFLVSTVNQDECVCYCREEVLERFSHRGVFKIFCTDIDELAIVLEEEE